MEKKQVLLIVILVLNQLSRADILQRNGAIGCLHFENLCRYDEFCNEAEFYPYGKCKRIIFRNSPGHIISKRHKNSLHQPRNVGRVNRSDFFDNTKYDMTYFESDGSAKDVPSDDHGHETIEKTRANNDVIYRNDYHSKPNRRAFDVQDHTEKGESNNGAGFGNYRNDLSKNGKYDITYYAENDGSSGDVLSHEQRSRKFSVNKNEKSPGTNLQRSYTRVGELENNNHRLEIVHNLERKRTSKIDDGANEGWLPIGIPLGLPKEKQRRELELKHEQSRNLQRIETRNSKSTNEVTSNKKDPETTKKNIQSASDESLDLDIEIKPLTVSISKYFDEDKSKLSSIPKKPEKGPELPQKIEHVRTNIVSKSASKKTKVGVLVGGKLDQTKADVVQNNSPDHTYDKVKDFFKSQQVSSIVDVPLTEKKKSVKLHSIPRAENEQNVKRSSIPKPVIHPDGIRLDLKERLNPDKAGDLLDALEDLLWGNDANQEDAFTAVTTDDNAVLFHLLNNTTTSGLEPSHIVRKINKDKSVKDGLKKAVGVTVLAASLEKSNEGENTEDDEDDDHSFMVTTLIVAGCVSGILLASVCIFIILRRTSPRYSQWVPKQAGQEAASEYQSLWRQLRQATWESPIQTTSVSHSDDGSQKGLPGYKGMPPKYSWSEEPVDTKMDISTGHVVLSYMEDHLKNENRLSREWEELSVYEAEPDRTDVGKDPKNSKKNRYSDVLPYDHNRVKLRDTSNATGSDYINASYIIDDDPRNPAYIATQGPLASTVADFWQMVWEQGVVVIVMLTKLADLGLPQCHRYWPQKGHDVYHIYQVHLISEHIWCSDYLVRSFYLKNIQTGETRTVTQFHYLTWPHLGIPFSSKPLLDFRRKVLKCFRSHSCPVVVHCSGGVDRTGTYILIDMVLSKMSRGTKEIDIAATLEYLRDQRPQMVKTKAQFEFALAAVAEEVNAILQVLTKH